MILSEGVSGNFNPEVNEYPRDSLAPIDVSTQTSNALDLYFSNHFFDRSPIIQFLNNTTLPFLESAELGFLNNFPQLDKLGLISERDRRIIDFRRQFITKPCTEFDNEAFNYTLVTFSAMPDLARRYYLPNGFSRRGMLQPPQTVKDFLKRIDEMKTEIQPITQSDPSEIRFPEYSISYLRTKLFFEVGGMLPKYNDPSFRFTIPLSTDEFSSLFDTNTQL